jgi:hypothetical protein
MGKDPTKYLYITISLTRGSEAEQWFTKDAEKHHMTDNPGKLAGLRLTEFYELMARGLLSPSLLAALGHPEPERTIPPNVPAEKQVEPDVVSLSHTSAEANAEDAGDYWTAL